MEKINYTLTLKDCNNFVRSQSKIPRLKKRFQEDSLKLCIEYIIALIIISFVLFNISIHDICVYNLIIFSLIFLIMLHLQKYLSGGKIIYKMLSGVDLNYEILISEENLTRINKNGTNITNWETVKDIYDTKYNYLIFISDLQAIIIPKRCFENDEQGKQFYEKVQIYYNNASKAK